MHNLYTLLIPKTPRPSQGTIELLAGPQCMLLDTLNVRDRQTNQIQNARSDLSTLQTHKYQSPEGEYMTDKIKRLVYDVSPTRGSDIYWMPPATKETTTPMPNFGEREPTQKPAMWKPPSGLSALTMLIRSDSGKTRNLRLYNNKITWFRKDGAGGGIALEERKADDVHTTMSLEISSKGDTVNLTTRKITKNNRIETTTENIYS